MRTPPGTPEAVTEAMDRICEQIGDHADPFTAAAARRILKNAEWRS